MARKNLETVTDILPFVGSNWKLWGGGGGGAETSSYGGKQL